MKTVDTIIIGSGGGTKIAQALRQLGQSVAVIEKDRAGGTCLNRGCIPSKMLIHPAGLAGRLRHSLGPHVGLPPPKVDFESLVASINSYTDGTSDSLMNHFEKDSQIHFYRGEARFVSDRVVAVNGEELTAETLIIATGSRPLIPDIPGLEGTPYMTSTDALRNRRLPRRLIVLGGGYIAAELGGAYAGFGSEVTYILRSSFLRKEDPEIIDAFRTDFSKDKTIHEHTRVLRIEYRGKQFTVFCEDAGGNSFAAEAEALLVATGVLPNSDRLGLENTGIIRKPDGFIQVDDMLQTPVPGVFALGDVVGNYLFRHSVNFEAEYWIESRCLAEQPFPIRYPPVPSAVFTHPELASVGLTEPTARKQGLETVIGRATYPSCAMAVARGLETGLVKLVFARDTGILLGAHIVGDEASTMIQELVLARTLNLTAADIYRQIYIHPAFPEVVRNAVRNALKQLDPRRAILF